MNFLPTETTMKTPNIQEFCARLWELRETAPGCLPCGLTLGRMLALAASDDVLLSTGYDPESDKRVAWCRELAAARRARPQERPAAGAALEFCVAYLLGRAEPVGVCGRSLAAGEREETRNGEGGTREEGEREEDGIQRAEDGGQWAGEEGGETRNGELGTREEEEVAA